MQLFWHGVFCELLSRPIDKIKMTRGRGRWPRDFRKLGWFSCALLFEKSVDSSLAQLTGEKVKTAIGIPFVWKLYAHSKYNSFKVRPPWGFRTIGFSPIYWKNHRFVYVCLFLPQGHSYWVPHRIDVSNNRMVKNLTTKYNFYYVIA